MSLLSQAAGALPLPPLVLKVGFRRSLAEPPVGRSARLFPKLWKSPSAFRSVQRISSGRAFRHGQCLDVLRPRDQPTPKLLLARRFPFASTGPAKEEPVPKSHRTHRHGAALETLLLAERIEFELAGGATRAVEGRDRDPAQS